MGTLVAEKPMTSLEKPAPATAHATLPVAESRPAPFEEAGPGGLRLALWSGFGGALGSVMAFGVLTIYAHHKVIPLLIASLWVLIWKHAIDPQIELKLGRHHDVHPPKDDAARRRHWLIRGALAVLLASMVLVIEMLAEVLHTRAREESLNFLKEMVGPTLTIFCITLGWVFGLRGGKRHPATWGALAGLAAPSLVFAGFGLPLYGWNYPAEYLTAWFYAAFFWTLAGAIGGLILQSQKGRPMIRIIVALTALVVVWNIGMTILFAPYFQRIDLVFTALLNTLRMVGWFAGMLLCPGGEAVLVRQRA